MRRVLQVLLFLMLVDEGLHTLYRGHMFAPFAWVHPVLYEPVGGIRPFDVVLLLVLTFNSLQKRSATRTVQPMRRTLLIAVLVIAAGFLHGVGMGGDARAASWQIYLLLVSILAAFTFASVFQTAEQLLGLVKTVVVAAIYRAVMCLVFYYVYLKAGAMSPFPDYVTSHEDTTLWVVGIGFFALNAIQTPKPRNILVSLMAIFLFLVAIQLNRRRLAWISLGGVLLTMYLLIPPSVAKRRVRRFVLTVAPILAIYTAIGWGHTEGIFKPLRAFESVSNGEDSSTKARNAENLGLIATLDAGGLVLGPGWGHRYVEITDKYQIHFFELWPYIPHNGVLGMLAYSGYLGFIGYWMLFPTAAYFHARTARLAERSVDRFVGVIGFIEVVTCANQWYGDMGYFSVVTSYLLGTSLAIALRVPLSAGVLTDQPRLSAGATRGAV